MSRLDFQVRKSTFAVRALYVLSELKGHVPFTAFGAATGILIMTFINLGDLPAAASHFIFYVFHPLHICLSALATTGMYRLHAEKRSIFLGSLIGYTGSVGIATLSDVIIPYLGAHLLGIEIPLVIPFISERWVNILAFVGILAGYLRPSTKFPHAGHVLLSTWASLFNITQFGMEISFLLFPFVFIFLFIAVWLPCCLSDIVYPLLFVKGKIGE